MPGKLVFRPDIDVNVVGPVIAVIAQYVPAGIVSLKIGLIPAGALAAEVLDLGRAVVAWPAGAYRPLK
jgi:hypothetical protein